MIVVGAAYCEKNPDMDGNLEKFLNTSPYRYRWKLGKVFLQVFKEYITNQVMEPALSYFFMEDTVA